MRRIYIYILSVVVAVLALPGCQNEDFDPTGGSVSPSFSASIKGERSRAIDSAWESGDKIGISYEGTNMPKNKCYVTPDGNGMFIPDSPEEQIYYMSGSQTGSVTFYAYYPWTSISSGTSISFDVSDQKNQRTFDFLTATGKGSKANPEVAFEFEHKMSKVTFVFKSGNEDVRNIDRFSLGDLKLKGIFNTSNNSVQTSGNTTEAVTMEVSELKDGEPAPSLILIPQTGLATLNLKIHCRNGLTPETTLAFPDNKLLSGTHYKCTITVNKYALTVNEYTITDWKDYWPEGGGQGTADSADDPDEEVNS